VVGMRALGAGLAVLGSRVGGIIDVVEEGRNGFLCPVNDSEFFEKCLRDMLNSPQMVRSMKEQRRKLAARFDLGHISRRLEEILYRATS